MKKIIYLLFALFITANLQAQTRKVVADKIVGVVGDKIILQSDIKNAILDAQRQGQSIPDNAECIIMEQALAQKALVLQAEKDSLVVSEEEIDGMLDNQIRQFIAMYGSKEALEQIAGRTVDQGRFPPKLPRTPPGRADALQDRSQYQDHSH
jgi:peptidyl-prolyl cis-trans isomerase SurA